MSFMLRARRTGAKRHRLVGNDRLVVNWIHAIMIGEQSRAEEYAGWLIEHNAGPEGFDSVQVIDAHRRHAKPLAVVTSATHASPAPAAGETKQSSAARPTGTTGRTI
jgi:hypothetical protein